MKHIILEDAIYKVSEKLFKEIQQMKKQILDVKWYPTQQSDMDDYLGSIKFRMRFLGRVNFDFRL